MEKHRTVGNVGIRREERIKDDIGKSTLNWAETVKMLQSLASQHFSTSNFAHSQPGLHFWRENRESGTQFSCGANGFAHCIGQSGDFIAVRSEFECLRGQKPSEISVDRTVAILHHIDLLSDRE
jgi:hypothetical protein